MFKYLRFAIIALIITACGDSRLSPQGGTITGATTGGGLVNTASRLGNRPDCAVNDWLIWNGTAWVCTVGAPVTPTSVTVGTPGGSCVDYSVMGPNQMVVGDPGGGCGPTTVIDPGSILIGGVAVSNGTGTLNTIPKWTPDGDTFGNSLLTDNATTLSYNAGVFTVTASNGNAQVAGTFNSTGNLSENTVRVATLAGAGMTKTGGTFDVIASTGGGLVTAADSVGMLTTCGNGEILKWTLGTTSWGCAADAGLADGDKGDITVTASGATWTIDNDVATYAKMQNVSATSRFLGRITIGAGDTEELTGTQATTLLDTFATAATTKGLVPGSNSAGASAYLNGNGAWTTPAGAGDITDVTVTGPACAAGSFMTTLTGGATSGSAPVGGTCTAATSIVSGTTNKIAKFTSATAVGNGWASDDGTTWGVASIFTITEASGNFRTFGTATVDGAATVAGNATLGDTVADTQTLWGRAVSNEAVGNTTDGSEMNLQLVDTTTTGIGVGGAISMMGAYTGTTTTTGALIKTSKTNATDGQYGFDLLFSTRVNGGALTQALKLDSTQNAFFPNNVTLGDATGDSHTINGTAVVSGANDVSTLSWKNPTYTLGILTRGAAATYNAGALQLNRDGISDVFITAASNGTTDFSGIVQIVNATETISVLNDLTGQTTGITNGVIRGRSNGTFNTTAGALLSVGSYGLADSTRSAGANSLLNIGLFGKATGGQSNYAIFGEGQTVIANSISGIVAAGVSLDVRTDANGGSTNVYGKLTDKGAPPTISSCGTSPSTPTGGTNGFLFTVGTGTATSCTITFPNSGFTASPSCNFEIESSTINAYISAHSATAITITGKATANLAGLVVNGFCIGN